MPRRASGGRQRVVVRFLRRITTLKKDLGHEKSEPKVESTDWIVAVLRFVAVHAAFLFNCSMQPC